MGAQDVRLHPAQVKALAAGQDGHRHLADFGGGEDELGVGWRFFQRLQQGVERLGRQHVHFVDDIDFVARLGRGIAHPVQQLAHLVDLGAAGRVQFQHVHVPAFDDRPVVQALLGQIDAGAMDGGGLIVERAGQQARRGGLADPPDAGQHEGMGDPAGRERVAQGAHHRFLPDQVLKGARPVLARQHRIGGRDFGSRWSGGLDRGGDRHGFGRRAEHVVGSRVPFGRLILPGRDVGIVRLGHGPIKHHRSTGGKRGHAIYGERVETERRPET